ncbi:MAG TPA: molybdopterin-dependent oxidoreductase [Candidatus Binataceae bacterium]|nr:molybdopterin-dependent oxidoreductase [Candidatus Binataceae bacterium]
MNRRRFIAGTGSTIIIGGLFGSAAIARAAIQHAIEFGGPTPNSDFYITSFGRTPSVDANTWRLKISGLVSNRLELTYDQIRAFAPVHERLTLECISNPPDGDAISNADWVGAPLKPILDKARLSPKAIYVAMRGADGYHTGVPIDEILRSENFLPYEMNGEALPAAHGYPVRIFIPGKYGMKQPKWITEIEFADHEIPGYWEVRGWSKSAWRKVNSGFFQPRPARGFGSFLSGSTGGASAHSPVDIWGWALAGPSGIKRVEMSTDHGDSWREAEIVDNRSPYVWTVWKYHFAAPHIGSYAIRVRATNGSGVTQPVNDPQSGNGMSGQPKMDLAIRP